MKCPKCGYTSFDYLRECKKCGEILDESRESLNLKISEPTLFANLEEDPSEDLVEVEKPTPENSRPAFSESDFPPSPPLESNRSDAVPLLRSSSDFTTPEEQSPKEATENITAGLGTLGSMDKVKHRSDEKEPVDDLLKIELESPTKELNGLELTPSFEDNNSSNSIDNNPEIEFDLFGKDDTGKTDMGDLLQEDIPFEFSTNDFESDSSLKLPDDNSVKDLIELELDMEDDESLDQILEDLQSDK